MVSITPAPGHGDVEQEHVDVARRARVEHAVRILSLADDLDVAVARDHVLEALADHRVIVGDHESNHASPMSFGIAIGTRSRTAVPRSPARPI